jgi:hypothetical protein
METHRGFLLVFVAGGITGAFFGGSYARYHFFELRHPERIGGRMKERFRAELNLTPEQLAKISPIIDNSTAQLRDIRRDRVDEFARSLPTRIARWLRAH